MMGDAPSLLLLCVETISKAIIDGHSQLQDIFELPLGLLDCLLMHLPPSALQNLHEELLFNDTHRSVTTKFNNGRKRGRLDCKHMLYDDFNRAWRTLFKLRWPYAYQLRKTEFGLDTFETEKCTTDWQQLYWEAHLQNCLDEASETALLPAFDGCIREITIPDRIMKFIGCGEDMGYKTCGFTKLSHHCHKYGSYARRLTFRNVLCVTETCELLRDSKLEDVIFLRIKSKTHVGGVCKLLKQNRDTLSSLEFGDCRLPSTALNKICSSVYKGGTQIHGIKHFSIITSSILEGNTASIPFGLFNFLSPGRSLCSLKLQDLCLGPKIAKLIVDTLVDSLSGIVTLEILDDNIAGWLSNIARRLKSSTPSCLGSNISLKSLRVLKIRGNNLHKDDAEDLRYALVNVPNLRHLDISDNDIMDEGIRCLIPYFIEAFGKEHPLSDLIIENCNLSSVGATELLLSIQNLREPLNSLSLADNDLGSCIAAPLATFLRTSRVKALNVEAIGLDSLGFRELEDGLPEKVELVHLNISKNRGRIGAASFVSKIILHAPELAEVGACDNFMPPESLPVICNALEQSKGKLERLDLTGNNHLYQPTQASMLANFCYHGRPIVLLPSSPFTAAPYDDDP